MTKSAKRFALIKSGNIQVNNTIQADEGLVIKGYLLQEIQADVFCEPGMFYNVSDGLYYQEREFLTISQPMEEAES